MIDVGSALSMFGAWCEQRDPHHKTVGFSITVHPTDWLLPKLASLVGMNGRPLTVYHDRRVSPGTIVVASVAHGGVGRDVAFGENRLRAMMAGPQ